jgi:hypothetical protein
VTVDDRSLGFTATDLLGRFGSGSTGQLTWYDGTSTTLHFQVRYDQPMVRVTGPGAGGAPAACRTMEVQGAVLTLSTDDGRLSAEDYPAYLYAELVGGTTTVWADASSIQVGQLHGSFRAPADWSYGPLSHRLGLQFTPQPESCNVRCAPSAAGSAYAFSSTLESCGYDGKLVWVGLNDGSRGCTPYATVAAWQWNQP